MADTGKMIAGAGVTIVTAAVLIATPVVSVFEGLWLTAKPDRLAYNIPTACYGETEGIKVGMKFTKSQCMKMLEQKLPRYEREIDRCIKVAVPDKVKAMMISLSYNIGTGAFCRSTVLRRLNAEDFRGACDAMLMWTRAGGKFRQGLLNRRNKERAICLEGINDKPERRVITVAEVTPPTVSKPWWKIGS